MSNVVCECKTLYVRPDNGTNSSCPGLPCETLDYYASVSHCNNTQFILMPGLHTLSRNFTLSCLENITLNGGDDSNITQYTELGVVAEIYCNETVGFIFQYVRALMFKNLSISHCGRKIPHSIFNWSKELHPYQAAVVLKDLHTLAMLSVAVQDSSGYGVLAVGLYGDSVLEECSFINNTGKKQRLVGGNLFVKYEQCPVEYTREQVSLTITRSRFLEGYTATGNFDEDTTFEAKATGISLIMACTNVSIHLLKVSLEYNKAFSYSSEGGNLFVLFGNTTHNRIIVEDSRITHGEAVMGGGAYIRFRQPSTKPANTNALCGNSVPLAFKNTNFTSNKGKIRGGAMYILFEMDSTYNFCPNGTVDITNCYFEDNILNTSNADSGVAINIYGYYLHGVLATSFPFYTVTITQCHFLRNKLWTKIANSLDLVSGGATVYITEKRRGTVICDTTFEDNSVPAISAVRSSIVFQGNVLIRNNSGINGGGLVLCEASYVLFSPKTTVVFKENSALLSGGGIYAEEQCLESKPMCFYQINADNSLPSTQKDQILNTIHVVMINNTANHAGSQIFGGSMDKCITTFVRNNSYVYSKIFNETSWQVNKSQDPSYITSRPRHICFCENKIWNCSRKSINVSVYPGEPFNVSLVAVGQFQNPVPATIAPYDDYSRTAFDHKTTNITCSNISYLTKNDKLNLVVSSSIGYTGGDHLCWVNVYFKPCPFGIHKEEGQCHWSRRTFYYNATDQTIHKYKYGWIGINDYPNKTNFLIFNFCPQWYCNNKVKLKIFEKDKTKDNKTCFDQDAQCNDRRGILCGACVESKSLAIASNKCITCIQNRYSYLPLLVLGILAMTVIVLIFMLCLNTTITEGTISGLLFYASIFSINRETLLRATKNYSFLPSLISWLNLDIGLNACFFHGFNAFWQAVFNFSIPVFLWVVFGLLIYASSKSSAITRLIGGNAVKVLATLFLVSYTKILKTEVAVLSCASIRYVRNDGSVAFLRSHWLIDGNMECWRGKHLLLVVIGLLFGVATVLFTLALLFIQPLQRNSHRRGLKWVATLKPFFDAYTSPHVIHDRYRFWNGLLLLFRMICTILFAITSINNEYKHYMFTVAGICALIISLMSFFGGVYKTKWLYALNVSFYFNLTTLSLASFNSLTKDDEKLGNDFQHIATLVSVSIAVATFALIICYHVYKCLMKLGLLTRCWQKIKESWQADPRYWSRRRVQYVRLPQEDLDRDREMDDDFDRGRESDDEQEEENREQDTSEGVAEQSRDTY